MEEQKETIDDIIVYSGIPEREETDIGFKSTNAPKWDEKLKTHFLKVLAPQLSTTLRLFVLATVLIPIIFISLYILFLFFGGCWFPDTYIETLNRCNHIFSKAVPPIVTYIAGIVTPTIQSLITSKKE